MNILSSVEDVLMGLVFHFYFTDQSVRPLNLHEYLLRQQVPLGAEYL